MNPLEEKQKPEKTDEKKMKKVPDLEVIDDKSMDKKLIIIGIVILVAGGIITGYFLSKSSNPAVLSMAGINSTKVVKTDKIVGSLDEKAFPDPAEGTLEKGGIDGEGTHKLVRDGGPSRTVYMTSSVINMDDYVGKKVKVWGETFAAQKAGWLMDVGRLEVLE